MDAGILIRQSITGLMPLIIVTILGIFLTLKNIFDKKTIDSIAVGYKNIFNPFFIFFNTVGVISSFSIDTLLPLLISPVIMIMTGLFVNFLHSLLSKPPENYSRVVKCAIAFSNTANLPVVLLKGICSPYGPLQGNPHCSYANSYIAIQFLTYNAIGWSYGWSLISIDKIQSESLVNTGTPSIFKSFLKNLTLPGPISCLLAFICGFIPGIQVFFEKSSYLYSLTEVGLHLGLAGIVFGQTTLGSNLMLLRNEERTFTLKYLFTVVLFKNILMPCISLGIVYCSWTIGVFGTNIVSAYIIYICFCSPTAFLLLLICQNLEYGVKEVTWLMMGIYAFSVPTLIIFSYIFFLLIN